MSKTLKDKLPEGITKRDINFSPEESKKRIKRILYQQKTIKEESKVYVSDLEKIYFPRFGPKHY